MAHKFAEIAFTPQVKQLQLEQNSRQGYAGMETGPDYNYLLSDSEAAFISARDSFYMASVSETNWPYVQHRGGPTGFLKVLDEKTIGFADYSGNRQYVSTGNFTGNDRVALILMDYVNQARLKILGRITTIDLSDSRLSQLEDEQFRAPVERGFIISIEAFDWNCPKYITPRYSEADVNRYTSSLQGEIAQLKKQLAQQSIDSQGSQLSYPQQLGQGDLTLKLIGIRQLTHDVRAYEFRDPQGKDLPQVTAGSHLQIPVQLANGELVYKHYSICSNPNRRDIYEIAVKKMQGEQSSSSAIHQFFKLGQLITCPLPENYFPLIEHQGNKPVILVAGGIGITPIKAIAQSLQSKAIPFELHYAGKAANDMPYFYRLQREFSERFFSYFSGDNNRIEIKTLLEANTASHFYLCGPKRMLTEFKQQAQLLGIDENNIHFERFSMEISAEAKSVTVHLARSQKTIEVDKDTSILDALLKNDIAVNYGCKTGTCRSCITPVISGEPEHLDMALFTSEKATNKLICPCVSRAKTSELTLDL